MAAGQILHARNDAYTTSLDCSGNQIRPFHDGTDALPGIACDGRVQRTRGGGICISSARVDDLINKRGQPARKRVAVAPVFKRSANSPAGGMSHHHDERGIKHSNGIFQTRDDLRRWDVACNTADKQRAQWLIEDNLGGLLVNRRSESWRPLATARKQVHPAQWAGCSTAYSRRHSERYPP